MPKPISPIPPAPITPSQPKPFPPAPPIGRGVPPPPPGVWQYVGARYVPIFADPLEWSENRAFEPLTIVTYNGNSYTSRQNVPVNVPPSDSQYWALTGNYNAQIDDLSTKIDGWDEQIAQNTATANAAQEAAQEAVDKVKDVPDFSQLTADVTQLQSDVAKNTTDLAAASQDATDALSLAQQATDDNATQETAITGLQTDVTALQTATNDLTTIRNNIAANASAIGTLNTSQAEQDTKIAALETDNTTNKSDISTLKTTVDTHTTEIGALETDMTTAQSDITELQTKMDAVQEASDTATEEVERLTGIVGDENSGLIKDFNDLKEAVEQGDTVDALNGRVGLLENQVGKPATGDEPATGIELKIANLQTEVGKPADSDNDATGLYGAIDLANQSVADANDSITALKQQVGQPASGEEPATGLVAEIETLNTSQAAQDTSISTLTTAVETNQSAISTVETNLTTLANQVGTPADGETAATGIEKKIADLQSQVGEDTADIGTRLDTLENEIDGKQDTITGTAGQIVGFNSAGQPVAQNAPATGVTTFNGRSGAVTPQAGDYTAEQVGALPISGGTMTGTISSISDIFSYFPNKSALFFNRTNDGVQIGSGTNNYIPSESSIIISGIKTPVHPSDSANKEYVDSKFLPLSGGTMQGAISFPAEDYAMHFFDALVGSTNKIIFLYSADVVGMGVCDHEYNPPTEQFTILRGIKNPIYSSDAANKEYVDNENAILASSIAACLAKTGGSMTGAIAMGSNKITGLATPTANTDAATKAYVDANAGGSVVGYYTGNQGITSQTLQTITLGFRPKAVFVAKQNNAFSVGTVTFPRVFSGFAIDGRPYNLEGTSIITITSTGFSVRNVQISSTLEAFLNQIDEDYLYIAFK